MTANRARSPRGILHALSAMPLRIAHRAVELLNSSGVARMVAWRPKPRRFIEQGAARDVSPTGTQAAV